jgi:hypothetical protein
MSNLILTLDSIPKTNPNVTGRLIEDEAVIVLPEKGKVEVLNQVGAFIWERADGSLTVSEIIEQICEEFSVERSEAQKDTLVFISDLIGRGVLSILE